MYYKKNIIVMKIQFEKYFLLKKKYLIKIKMPKN